MRVATVRTSILAAATFFAAAAAAGAQSTQHAYVSVAAHDSTGAPITAAEVTVTRGIKDVVARGSTNDDGHTLLAFDTKDSVDMQVTVRKIGYPRSDYFFAAGPRDTAIVQVVVAPPKGQTLATVKVSAAANPKWKSYHLDADDIAAADMPLFTGWDVVKRLRPDMLTSRGGCSTGIQNVWVNGKRIVLPLRPTGMAAATARTGVPPRARFSYVAVSVMADIAPEHIQELIYHDCFDASMAAVGSNDALFIVLKPGIGYQRDVGSFVDETYGKPNP
jgi:hypothetical protein